MQHRRLQTAWMWLGCCRIEDVQVVRFQPWQTNSNSVIMFLIRYFPANNAPYYLEWAYKSREIIVIENKFLTHFFIEIANGFARHSENFFFTITQLYEKQFVFLNVWFGQDGKGAINDRPWNGGDDNSSFQTFHFSFNAIQNTPCCMVHTVWNINYKTLDVHDHEQLVLTVRLYELIIYRT